MDKYDYVIVKPEMEEVLYHAGFHKYIDKYLGKNGKWIYKYAGQAKNAAKGAYYSGKSKVLSTVTKARRYKNKYQHVITDNNGRTLSIASLDNENFGMNPSSRKGQKGSRNIQGISAGRKRAKKQILSAKIGAKTKGYSRKGNVTSRGYSGSQGSGESKRQRNLGTRYSKNMRLSAEYLRERAYNSKKNRL